MMQVQMHTQIDKGTQSTDVDKPQNESPGALWTETPLKEQEPNQTLKYMVRGVDQKPVKP